MFTDLSRDLRKFKIEGKFFKARVVNNNDKEKHPDKQANQRIQIFINDLHDGMPPADLPWAIKMGPMGTGSLPTEGSVSVPTIGSTVLVIMQDNSDEYPIYMGSTYFTDTQLNELLEINYPFTYGWIDHANNIWYIDTKANNVYFNTVTGTVIHIDSHGSLTVISNKDTNISTTGNTSILTKGTTDIQGSGTMSVISAAAITIGAPAIHIKGVVDVTDGPPAPTPPLPPVPREPT